MPFLRTALLVLLFSTFSFAATRPNILLIVSDDMGWNGPSYHHGFAHTPNIDRISSNGIELNHFYVSPMCSPTRAGLLTGRYPMHFGMARSVVHPWSRDGLPPEEITLPEALTSCGYTHRALFGKWHLGHADPKWHPLNEGFTLFHGCYLGEIDYFTKERVGQVDWHHNFDDIDEPGYVTDLIADHTCDFIKAHAKDGPFFCYTAFTAPHTPFEVPKKYLDLYPNLTGDKQAMAGLISALDDGIGRILDSVNRAGIADNTLIFFINDNGGITSVPGNNTPLRDGKFSVYEGGVRVPAALWWPGHLGPHRKIDTPIMNIDVMPTLLALLHLPEGRATNFDGHDISPLLENSSPEKPLQRDMYFFCGQWGLDNEQNAITTPEGWKLIIIGPDLRRPAHYQSPQHRVELYHLPDDESEQHNLAADHPDLVAQLAKKLIAFRASEPIHSMPPIPKKPAGFVPPPHWHNARAN